MKIEEYDDKKEIVTVVLEKPPPQHELLYNPITYVQAFKELLVTGATISGSLIILQLDEFLSVYLLKNLNSDALEAILLIQREKGIAIGLLSAPVGVLSVLVSAAIKGQKPNEEIAAIFQAGLLTGVVFSLPYILFAALNKYILVACGQDPVIAEEVQDFFWGYLPSITPFFLQYAAAQFFLGAQKRILTVAIDAGGTALSLGLTYIFSYGLGALPRQGMRGYGFAKTVATLLCVAGYGLLLQFYPYFRSYRLFSCQWQLKEKIIVILKLGLPVMVAVFGEIGLQFASVLMAGALGREYLIAQSIVAAYNSLMVISILGFFRATSILVSGAVAQTRFNDVNRYILSGTVLTSLAPLIFLAGSLLIPRTLANVFLNSADEVNPVITNMLKLNLPLSAGNDLLDGIRLVLMGALLGKQDVIIPTIGNLITQLFIMLPLMYVLAFHTQLELAGLQIGNMIGIVLMSTLMCFKLFMPNINCCRKKDYKDYDENTLLKSTTISNSISHTLFAQKRIDTSAEIDKPVYGTFQDTNTI
ncbi:MAG: MATE family efflux transporter [Gammaproteobacteria bacterium]